MCMEPGVHSIKPVILSRYVVHLSPWAQRYYQTSQILKFYLLAPFSQIACLLFHLNSQAFFVTKICLGVSCEGSGFAGVVQDAGTGGGVVRHAAVHPGNPWSKGGLGRAF